jgi:hypothetical protein
MRFDRRQATACWTSVAGPAGSRAARGRNEIAELKVIFDHLDAA